MRKSFLKWLYEWAFVRLQTIESNSRKQNGYRNYLILVNHEEWSTLTEVIGSERQRNQMSCMRSNEPKMEGFFMDRGAVLTNISQALESAINHQR